MRFEAIIVVVVVVVVVVVIVIIIIIIIIIIITTTIIIIIIIILVSPLCRVFTIIYLKQTMFLRNTVLQLFCMYNLCYM